VEDRLKTFYDFRHEVWLMSGLNHPHVVNLKASILPFPTFLILNAAVLIFFFSFLFRDPSFLLFTLRLCLTLSQAFCLNPFLIVMEWVPMGDMYRVLHNEEMRPRLTWPIRLRMASEIALVRPSCTCRARFAFPISLHLYSTYTASRTSLHVRLCSIWKRAHC
jgi:hypothetical protein